MSVTIVKSSAASKNSIYVKRCIACFHNMMAVDCGLLDSHFIFLVCLRTHRERWRERDRMRMLHEKWQYVIHTLFNCKVLNETKRNEMKSEQEWNRIGMEWNGIAWKQSKSDTHQKVHTVEKYIISLNVLKILSPRVRILFCCYCLLR